MRDVADYIGPCSWTDDPEEVQDYYANAMYPELREEERIPWTTTSST